MPQSRTQIVSFEISYSNGGKIYVKYICAICHGTGAFHIKVFTFLEILLKFGYEKRLGNRVTPFLLGGGNLGNQFDGFHLGGFFQ